MPIAPAPAALTYLSGRRFAFYPPIRNIRVNEWIYRRTTWSECIVANAESGEEYCIPRQYLGEASTLDDPPPSEPATVVDLHPELEWRNGTVQPFERRVIELPVEVADSVFTPISREGRLAPVVSIRLDSKSEPGAGKWIGVAMLLGAVVCSIVAGMTSQSHRRTQSDAVSRAWLNLNGADDYQSVLKKLGVPGRERSFEQDGKTMRVLVYPALRFSVVLKGRSVTEVHYTETVDLRGHVLGNSHAAF